MIGRFDSRSGSPPPEDDASILTRIHGTLDLILSEVRQLRVQKTRKIEPKWLTIAEASAYSGMSGKWVRSLEAVAPRGLFTRVRGTVFVNRQVLDDIFDGQITLEDA